VKKMDIPIKLSIAPMIGHNMMVYRTTSHERLNVISG
jgi:hypothetical protein